MEFTRKIRSIDNSELLKQYKKLESEITWETRDPRTKQSSLQFKKGEDPFLSSCLSLSKGANENDYNILNPFYKGTIFEDIINEYSLVRCRFMWVYEKSCYTIHKDPSKRIHIPLVTNPNCYFLFTEPVLSIHHLDVDHIHLVDTTYLHTFCNFSFHHRLHFLGCYNE